MIVFCIECEINSILIDGSSILRFTTECVAEVASRTLTAEPPSYATIMELDRKVREFSLPEDALTAASPHIIEDPSLARTRCILGHIREICKLDTFVEFLQFLFTTFLVLLYIHRSFFAQAIKDNPKNPLKSPYTPSFLAAYRASATILKSIKEHFALQPVLYTKFWGMWTFAFSAAVCYFLQGPNSLLTSH